MTGYTTHGMSGDGTHYTSLWIIHDDGTHERVAIVVYMRGRRYHDFQTPYDQTCGAYLAACALRGWLDENR